MLQKKKHVNNLLWKRVSGQGASIRLVHNGLEIFEKKIVENKFFQRSENDYLF